ncbi:MAG: hypothetical protein M5U34_27655 [Chloroflexi bacterium]|nr:hypothetical protein [Chloroflexota bacterium]
MVVVLIAVGLWLIFQGTTTSVAVQPTATQPTPIAEATTAVPTSFAHCHRRRCGLAALCHPYPHRCTH